MVANTHSLSEEQLESFRDRFNKDEISVLALNACTRADPLEVCISRTRANEMLHVFSHKVELEGKPITNQKNSGRCWLFAALNVIRIPFMKHYNIEEFEFSQSYLFLCDKIERSNFFLNAILETFNRGEDVEGRLVSHLLADPISDGGQWDMSVNLINKYGLIPKKCFPDAYSSETSRQLNRILESKLREYAIVLRTMLANGSRKEDATKKIQEQMYIIYRIVCICLGMPPKQFIWEYCDKNKQYHKQGPLTPVEFYTSLVKPHYDVNDKVCLVNDPRSTSPYGKLYTIDCLGNVVAGQSIKFNNQPIEVLINATAESIKNNETVWFGCEIGKRYARKLGLNDLQLHDYKVVFGEDVTMPISKADRMVYGESKMTHAMIITAVSIDEKTSSPTKWRVENSWGDDNGDKGYVLMTSEWYKEFVYEIVVDKKYLTQEVLDVYNQQPIVLPLWDPMGVLAK